MRYQLDRLGKIGSFNYREPSERKGSRHEGCISQFYPGIIWIADLNRSAGDADYSSTLLEVIIVSVMGVE